MRDGNNVDGTRGIGAIIKTKDTGGIHMKLIGRVLVNAIQKALVNDDNLYYTCVEPLNEPIKTLGGTVEYSKFVVKLYFADINKTDYYAILTAVIKLTFEDAENMFKIIYSDGDTMTIIMEYQDHYYNNFGWAHNVEGIFNFQEEEILKRKQELYDFLEHLAEKQADLKYREEFECQIAEEMFEAKEAEVEWNQEMVEATHINDMYDYEKFWG